MPCIRARVHPNTRPHALRQGLFGAIVHRNCHMLGDPLTFVVAVALQVPTGHARARARARTHTRKRTRKHARTHTHTQALSSSALGQMIGAVLPSPATVRSQHTSPDFAIARECNRVEAARERSPAPHPDGRPSMAGVAAARERPRAHLLFSNKHPRAHLLCSNERPPRSFALLK